MQLYLDSADPSEIAEVREWGVLDGVTTNPSLIAYRGGEMQETLRQVVDASPGPVLCQVIGWSDAASLAAQARWLHRFSERIVVKLPMSRAGIQALLGLKGTEPEIKVAVTMVCSVAQAVLAGKAGADIVALFNGPLEQAVDQEVDLVTPVRKVYDSSGFTTSILSCGRFPNSAGRFAAAGTDICTMKREYFALLYEHPFTDKRLAGFMEDWRKAFGQATWPTAE